MAQQTEPTRDPYNLTPDQQALFNRAMMILLGIGIGWLLFADKEGYATNIFTEVLGVAGTFFVLDYAVRQRDKKLHKEREIEQLRRDVKSDINNIARHAVNVARAKKWLTISDKEPIFRGVALTDPNFEEGKITNLVKVDLRDANLERSFLSGINLYQAKLQGANLENALLEDANLTEADLSRANLKKARLTGAFLSKAVFSHANLQDTNLRTPFLEETIFFESDLENADLRGAKLGKANFYKAILKGANLAGANLEGTSLHGANLQGCYLEGANFNMQTVLPDGTYWNRNVTEETLAERFGAIFNYLEYHTD